MNNVKNGIKNVVSFLDFSITRDDININFGIFLDVDWNSDYISFLSRIFIIAFEFG